MGSKKLIIQNNGEFQIISADPVQKESRFLFGFLLRRRLRKDIDTDLDPCGLSPCDIRTEQIVFSEFSFFSVPAISDANDRKLDPIISSFLPIDGLVMMRNINTQSESGNGNRIGKTGIGALEIIRKIACRQRKKGIR